MLRDPRYYFRCFKGCGEYAVSREYFLTYLPPSHLERVAQMIAKGAAGAVFEFEDECPRCARNGRSRGKVKMFWA